MADERIEKSGHAREKKTRRKRKREIYIYKGKEKRELVFLRSSTSRGAFRVATIKAVGKTPWLRLDDDVVFLSKTDHRTEKTERARNFTQCQEIKVLLYIRLYSFHTSSLPPLPLPLFPACLPPLLSILVSGRIKSTLRGGKKKIPHPTRRLFYCERRAL